MIYALNICGSRDQELSEMCALSLKRHCHDLEVFDKWNLDSRGWGNGAGWEASMLKIDALKSLFRFGIRETDFVLCVDSDVIFTSGEVFNYVFPDYGIMGIKNFSEASTPIGPLRHFSGCSIYLRGDIARKITELKAEDLSAIHREFKSVNLCENEDIVLSYCAQRVGAVPFELPGFLYDGNFEQDIQDNSLKSFYHLNYSPTTFLDMPVTGKWDIPKVLKFKEYDLW